MPTLTIDFPAPSPLPSKGYRVLFRPVGTTTYEERVNYVSPPLHIEGVEAATSYEGLVFSICNSGEIQKPFTFTAPPVVQVPCASIAVAPQPNTIVYCQTDDGKPPRPYQKSVTRLTATIPYAYTVNMYVTARLVTRDACTNEVGQGFLLILIPAGQLSAFADFTTSEPVNCPDGCLGTVAEYKGVFTQSPTCLVS